MARQINVDLTSNTADFEQGMKSATGSVDKFEAELKSADSAAGRFDGAMDSTADKLGSATGGFRSTADLAGGLGDVLGISAAGPIAGYAMGMADIADGLGGLLAPALGKAKAAFLAMNATLLANPIFLVIAAVAALGIAFVVAYKKSETFRNIVNKSFAAVKQIVVGAAETIARGADLITKPYQIAFKAIASAWNSTIGALEVNIPGFLGFGGISFGVPDIPIPSFLADGGIVTGPTNAIIGERGPEAVIPLTGPRAGQFGGPQRIELVLSGDAELVALMRRSVRTRGGNVQVVLGGS